MSLNEPFARITRPRSSSSTMPSTAVSNTSRRCSSDLAQGFVRFADALERRVGLVERGRLLGQRLGGGSVRLGAGDLVRQDAGGHPDAQQADDQHGLHALDPARGVERRDDGEGGTGRHHRDAREHRAGPPTRLLLHARLVSGRVDDQGGEREWAQHERDVDRARPRRRTSRGSTAIRTTRSPRPSLRRSRTAAGASWSGATATRRRTPRSGPRSAPRRSRRRGTLGRRPRSGRIITYSSAVSEAVIRKTSTPISRRSRTSKCSRYSARARPTIGTRNSANARSTGTGHVEARIADRHGQEHQARRAQQEQGPGQIGAPRPSPALADRAQDDAPRQEARPGDQRLGGEGLLVESHWGRRGRSPPRPRRRATRIPPKTRAGARGNDGVLHRSP